jgi:hypothetical protein
MIVPQAPGGAADFTARLLAEDLSSRLGRPVVVDNRPGGGMIVGTQALAMAAPDGNTFGMVFSPHAVNQAMRHQMPYNALTDFEPVCLGGHSIVVLVAHPGFAARSVAELIELARRVDPPLQFASLGIGSVSHLAGELLAVEADVALEHVPYGDSAQVYPALIRGDLALGVRDAGVRAARTSRPRRLRRWASRAPGGLRRIRNCRPFRSRCPASSWSASTASSHRLARRHRSSDAEHRNHEDVADPAHPRPAVRRRARRLGRAAGGLRRVPAPANRQVRGTGPTHRDHAGHLRRLSW